MASTRVPVAIIEMAGFRLFFYHIVSCGLIMCQLCVLYYWEDGFLFLGIVGVRLCFKYLLYCSFHPYKITHEFKLQDIFSRALHVLIWFLFK